MFNSEIMREARRIADTDGMGAAAHYLRQAQASQPVEAKRAIN